MDDVRMRVCIQWHTIQQKLLYHEQGVHKFARDLENTIEC